MLPDRVGEPPATIRVPGELIERCRARREQHHVTRVGDGCGGAHGRGHHVISLGLVDLDQGHAGRVSRERLAQHGTVRSEKDDRAQALRVVADQRRRVDPLELTPRDPDHRAEGGEGGMGGMGVGGLRVVDPHDPGGLGDHLGAVGVDAEGADGIPHRDRGRPGGARQRGCGQHVLHRIGRGQPGCAQVVHGGQLERRVMPIVEECPVDQDAVDQTHIARPRHDRTEPDGAGAVLNVGVLHHRAGGLVAEVVHARHARVGVHLRLRVTVRMRAAVPVVVVIGEVEAHARQRRDLARGGIRAVLMHPVQLVARQLHHQHVEPARVTDRIEHRDADVAARRGPQSGRDQHGGGQLRGGGLAVGPGDQDPLGGSAVRTGHLVAQAPRELDIAPDGDAALPRPEQQRVIGVVPRRHHHEFGVEHRERGVGVGGGSELGADDLEKAAALVVGTVGDHQHRGAELGEGVGSSEPGDARAENGDPQTAPVGVPAAERGEVAAHDYRLCHSR